MGPTKKDWEQFEIEAEDNYESFIVSIPGNIDIKDAYVSGYKLGASEYFIDEQAEARERYEKAKARAWEINELDPNTFDEVLKIAANLKD